MGAGGWVLSIPEVIVLGEINNHAPSHAEGGGDPVDIKVLAGYPNDPLQFLRGDKTFAVFSEAEGAHALSHQPGGLDPMEVDAIPTKGSLRTLGPGSNQAAPGDDNRFINSRPPTAHATTHQPGGSDPMVVDAVGTTGSLRTLGSGPNQAAPGNDPRIGAAHALTHQNGSSDPVDLKTLAGYTGEAFRYLSGSGVFSIPATQVHAPTHAAGQPDAVDVKGLAGYPGGTGTFLRADGQFAVPSNVPGGHHVTHEVGGSDQITGNLAVNSITATTANFGTLGTTPIDPTQIVGTVPPEKLPPAAPIPPNIAFKDQANVFTQEQTVTMPVGGFGPSYTLKFVGETAAARFTKAVPGNRMDITTNLTYSAAVGTWTRDDMTKEGGLLTIFDDGRIGYYIAHAGANPVTGFDLPFQIMPAGDVLASGHVVAGGDLKAGAAVISGTYVYPGLIHGGPGQQISYFLAASTTYGLYSNTGLYVAAGLWTGTHVSCGTSMSVGTTLTVAGISTFSGEINALGGSGTVYYSAPIEIQMTSHPRVAFHWGGIVASQIGMDSTGTVRTYDNPGTGYERFAASNITANGTLHSTVNLTVGSGGQNWDANGNLQLKQFLYPGRADIAPTTQASWYLASHAGYGLYTNTGFYLAGGIYPQGGMDPGYLTRCSAWVDASPIVDTISLDANYMFGYSIFNNMMTVSWMIVGYVPHGSGYIAIRIPASRTALKYACNAVNMFYPGSFDVPARAEVQPGGIWIYIYPNGAAYNGSQYYVYGQITFPVQ